MMHFANLPSMSIRWKLALLITLLSSFALIVVSAALLVQEARTFRRSFTQEVSTLADIMATNTEVAVVFDDEKAAAEVLESLAAEPRILLARLYSVDGEVSASYSRDGSTEPTSANCRDSVSATSFGYDTLSVNRDIVWQEETIGQLCIVASTVEFDAQLRRGMKVTGSVLLAAVAATFLLSMTFQRVFSGPILELAKAAQAISRKDYDIRVPVRSHDELGLLAGTFNRMVREIQARDLALVDAQSKLQKQVTVLHHEISERQHAEKALRDSEEELRHAQKMEAVGLLAGGIAHDFNNLLTAVIGYSALIAECLDPSEEIKSHAEQITGAGLRAADLTKQLLAFSRKQILEPEVLNLNDSVTSMRDMMERLIGEHTLFEFDLSPDLVPLRADPSQIEQVLLNLVVNARDAMPEGGVIEITTEMAECPSAAGLAKDGDAPRHCVKLSVRDTGCGMDEQTQEKIFEPFFTTKPTGKGTGLGLSTVFGIVKQSGGEIMLNSSVGNGSTFTIYLPAEAGAGAEDQAAELLLTETAGETVGGRRSGTILVAEDQPRVRDFVTAALEQVGYTVLAAKDGEAAVELSRSYGEPIDLLLTDVVMPGRNGYEVWQAVAKDRPEMDTLFMSGYADRDIVSHGVLIEGIDLLRKPFSPAQLRHLVAGILARARKPAVDRRSALSP